MAEIEHYVDPEDKSHEHFKDVRDVELTLLDRHVQSAGETTTVRMTIGEAVDKGIVANETLGYFIARINMFLLKVGIDPSRLRFRQHMSNEMAHYATDCWDAEIHNSYGWTECVGCADRAAYDLSVHSAKTGHQLIVRQALKEPIVTEKQTPEFNKKILGKTFGKDASVITKLVEGLDNAQLVKLQADLAQGFVNFPRFAICRHADSLSSSAVVTISDGKQISLTSEMLTIEMKIFKQSGKVSILRAISTEFLTTRRLVREFIPNVIEPSFGLGRILYSLLEHSFWARKEDVDRGVRICSSDSHACRD